MESTLRLEHKLSQLAGLKQFKMEISVFENKITCLCDVFENMFEQAVCAAHVTSNWTHTTSIIDKTRKNGLHTIKFAKSEPAPRSETG